MINKLIQYIYKPNLLIEAAKRKIRHRKLDSSIFNNIFDNHKELNDIYKELADTGLVTELNNNLQQFESVKNQVIRGKQADSGVISSDEGTALYAIIRKLKPDVVVETGVCSGYSTAMLLKAMELNNKGQLYSIDFPEVLGEEYNDNDFWEGKGGAVVPNGKESGWLIPESLKGRWHLHLGKTQDLLEPLLKELGQIDIFIHDSEHSYECMWYEYNCAWEHIKNSGYLISDDIGWNSSFFDFAKKNHKTTGHIAGNMGIIKN